MIYFNKAFSNTENYLKSWQEILGGELEDNCLRCKEGVVYSYKFNTHHIFVVQLRFSEEVVVKRSSFDPFISYNLMISDNLRFAPGRSNVVMALPSRSTLTSVFVSNKNALICFPANYDLDFVVMHVPFTTFEQMLPSGHEFLFRLHNEKLSHYYESFNIGISKLMNKIFKESYPALMKNEYLKNYSWELFLNFFNEYFYSREMQYNGINAATKNKMEEVRDYVLSNLALPKNIKELEVFSGMSASKLRSDFKKVYGISIYNMFQKKRMDQAWYLINNEKMSVSEVAYKLGYSNLSHFTDAFKKIYGYCPSECKQK